jgi:hypothetical protein
LPIWMANKNSNYELLLLLLDPIKG